MCKRESVSVCVRRLNYKKCVCVKCANVVFFSLSVALHPFLLSKNNNKKKTSMVSPPLVLLLQHYDTSLLLFVLSASLSLSALRGLDEARGCRVSHPGLGG